MIVLVLRRMNEGTVVEFYKRRQCQFLKSLQFINIPLGG